MNTEQRTRAIKWFEDRAKHMTMPGAAEMCGLAVEALQQPTIDPVKHGFWIKHDDGSVTCSVCKRRLSESVFGYPYAACCGARMDGEV